MATTLRSTNVITSFVELTDEMAALKLRSKQLEREIEEMTPAVLEQIGERREVRVNKQVRILTPRIDEKISRACDDETAVEWCRQHGLKFSERTPFYVAPASFTKYVKENRIPESMIERTTTTAVSVQ
tara:strand:+ start:98 stop:481 length:384 start_codon:yes stop_codon:yes gene_type:complete